MAFLISIKISRFVLFFFFVLFCFVLFCFFLFGVSWCAPQLKSWTQKNNNNKKKKKKKKKRLKYWFVKTECLKVMTLHFSGKFHAWNHSHVKLLQRCTYTCKRKGVYFSVSIFSGNIHKGKLCVFKVFEYIILFDKLPFCWDNLNRFLYFSVLNDINGRISCDITERG